MDDIDWQKDHGNGDDRSWREEQIQNRRREPVPSSGNHDTRTLLHEQPDDEFTREAARLRATIEDPIREGNVAMGLNALGNLVELYTTLSRGTVRERRARKEAEAKLHEIRRMITDA